MNIKLIADMHNHTLASGHAYSTVQEIAFEANKKGLKFVGITDHGPDMPGGPHIFHIFNQKVIPAIIHDVNILKGVEANILDKEGTLDLPDDVLASLDIVIASLHDVCIEPTNEKDHTDALINAMKNKYVDIIGHPGNPGFPVDVERLVLAAKETNTLIEINNSSFVTSRIGSEANCINIALACKKHKVPVIVDSDSHISFDVGASKAALNMLNSIKMPEELIINSSEKRFTYFLNNRKRTK